MHINKNISIILETCCEALLIKILLKQLYIKYLNYNHNAIIMFDAFTA